MLRLLLLKLGSNPETRPIVEELRARLGNCQIVGVEDWLDTPNSVYDEVITSHDDALFGAYSKMDMDRLYMTPTLYEEFRRFEGLALRMVDRVKYHDQDDYRRGKGMPRYDDTTQARIDLVFRHVLFWDAILRRFQFDAVFAQNLPHIGWELPVIELCKQRGVPTLIFHEVGQFPRTQYLQEDANGLGNLELGARIKQLCKDQLATETPNRIVSNLGRLSGRSKSDDPLFSRFGPAQGKDFNASVIASLLNEGNPRQEIRNARDVSRAIYTKARRFLRAPLKSSLRLSRSLVRANDTRISQRDERKVWSPTLPQSKYVYFPLHFQPEASTTAKGRYFVEQREAVALIASSLPDDWALLVKEHPHQYRRLYPRHKNYWLRIANIPRVHVAPIHSDNGALIDKSEGVVSISHSSVTADAWARGKRVAFLGDSHLREAPGTITISTAEELTQFWERPHRPITHAEMVEYLRRVEDSTFEGTLGGYPGYLPKDQAENLISLTQRNITEAILAWLSIKGLCRYPDLHEDR